VKQTISQGGSTRLAQPRPKRADFIAKWLKSHASFHIDGTGPDHRAALRVLAIDPTLELVPDDSMVGSRAMPGWRLQRRAR
jgi:hypothetical protein